MGRRAAVGPGTIIWGAPVGRTVEGPAGTVERPAPTAPLAPAYLLLLFALVLLTVFLVLEPLQGFPVFGSDTGEYYRLTQTIVATGHLPSGYFGLPSTYLGWGTAYPDFPGIFLLSAAVAGATGTGTLAALSIAVPVVTALSVLPLFLLFRRIFPSDPVALLGAGFASVAFPRIFSLAHPAPLALGDFFVVASLWMFVEGRRDPRWYVPLALSSGALIVTHHLSSYFFAVSAIASFVLVELYRPGTWSQRFPLRELAFSWAFLAVLFAFWFVYAKSFLFTASEGLLSNSPLAFAAFEAIALLLVGAAGLLLRWRRAAPRRSVRVRFPSDRSTARDFVLLLAGTFGGILLLTVYPLPGTTQTTTVAAVLLFTPILLLIPFAAGTRRLITTSRLGPWLVAWLFVVGASALIALATGNSVLSPSRHAEYLVIPLGLVVAVGMGRLIARAGDRAGRGAIAAGAVAAVLLVGANAAIAYPPPADFGGFQEGLTAGDAALWGWAGVGLPPTTVVASDHRLSSMLFGFDGLAATWDSTPALFLGSNYSAALAELNSSLAPHEYLPIDAVAVDSVMRTSGVALNPSAPATPMSAAAEAWFDRAPFVPLYENGGQAVYWVDGPLDPDG